LHSRSSCWRSCTCATWLVSARAWRKPSARHSSRGTVASSRAFCAGNARSVCGWEIVFAAFWLRKAACPSFGVTRDAVQEQARGWSRAKRFHDPRRTGQPQSYLIVNGEESPFSVRADYVVERNGVRAIVEVKTGAVASPSSRGTRRQDPRGNAQVSRRGRCVPLRRRRHAPFITFACRERPKRPALERRNAYWFAAAFAAGMAVSALAYWLT
jgi:hypothetical protein